MDPMMLTPEIEGEVQQLAMVVGEVLNPATSQQRRHELYMICEDIKEKSTNCPRLGLALSQQNYPSITRHFGLQLLTHCVRFRWQNKISNDEKAGIKNRSIELIQEIKLGVMEEIYIVDSISRLLVELMKREWPQHWPDLMNRLLDLCNMGNIINTNRLANSTLMAMTGYLDWVNHSYVKGNDYELLKLLLILLANENLKIAASECLLQVTGRKSESSENYASLVEFFLCDSCLDTLCSAAKEAAEISETDLENFNYFRRLCQIITNIGSVLITLAWENCQYQPSTNLKKYLNIILALTNHPCQTVSAIAQPLWISFMSSEHIRKNDVLREIIPGVLSNIHCRLIKVNDLNSAQIPGIEYLRMEFSCNRDYYSFMSQYKSSEITIIKLATKLLPEAAFKKGIEWLDSIIYQSNEDDGTLWEAVACYLEKMIGILFVADSSTKPSIAMCNEMISVLLRCKIKDPVLLTAQLSCLNAFFPCLVFSQSTLGGMLQLIFDVASRSFEAQEKQAARNENWVAVRRKATGLLVKLSKQYPQFLLPLYDDLVTAIKPLLNRELSILRVTDYCNLIESLLLLSNIFYNFDRHCFLIHDLLTSVRTVWLSTEIRTGFSTPSAFLNYIGFDSPDTTHVQTECLKNRLKINYCLSIILTTLKAVEIPSPMTSEAATQYIHGNFEDGSPRYRLPHAESIYPLLDNIMVLTRLLNSLYDDNVQKKSQSFNLSYIDLRLCEKIQLLGIHSPPLDNEELLPIDPKLINSKSAAQNFFFRIYENCYNILGCLGKSLPDSFYERLSGIIEDFTEATFPFGERLSKEWERHIGCQYEDIIHVSEQEDQVEIDNPLNEEILKNNLLHSASKEFAEFLGMCLTCNGSNSTTGESEGKAELSKDTNNLGQLGLLMLQDKDMYFLITASLFSSLRWKSAAYCNRALDRCNLVLESVLVSQFSNEGLVQSVFSMLLMGLQIHGSNNNARQSLIHLSARLYELGRNRYPSLKNLLLKIPGNSVESIEHFDTILPTISERKKKDKIFKELVNNVIGKDISDLFKREFISTEYMLPPQQRKTKKVDSGDVLDSDSSNNILLSLFS
ncbi:Exportin-5 [Trichoplax sp. H2]|nr:Exportin-5 [Trichoplax sp. H2]|eukprot:RDD40871.1 Exportin-5 [Trichoplax sp. H2]